MNTRTLTRKSIFTTLTGLVAALAIIFIANLVLTSTTHAASTKPVTYVAIGDSIAAGAGLAASPTANADQLACGQSPFGYPNQLATKLKTTVTNLSCSGAKSSEGLIAAQTLSNRVEPSQLDRAFQNGTPSLITVTIGANDVNWTQFISKCYVSTCGGWKDTSIMAANLTYFQGKLAYVLHQIKDRSGSNTPPKVLVTGYYNPVASNTSCLGGKVTAAEAKWIGSETDNLNKAIRQTITATTKVSSLFKGTYNFAAYVPIGFAGHELCSTSPWVQGLTDAAPIHPTPAGDTVIANALYSYAK